MSFPQNERGKLAIQSISLSVHQLVSRSDSQFFGFSACQIVYYYGRISPMAAKKTYQPKAKKHSRVHGFLKRMASATGRRVLKRRRAMGRKNISA